MAEQALNYTEHKVSIEINGRYQLLTIRVDDEVCEFAGGVKAQLVVFIKKGGEIGAHQWWTPDNVVKAVNSSKQMVDKTDLRLKAMGILFDDDSAEELPA